MKAASLHGERWGPREARAGHSATPAPVGLRTTAGPTLPPNASRHPPWLGDWRPAEFPRAAGVRSWQEQNRREYVAAAKFEIQSVKILATARAQRGPSRDVRSTPRRGLAFSSLGSTWVQGSCSLCSSLAVAPHVPAGSLIMKPCHVLLLMILARNLGRRPYEQGCFTR